MKSIMESYSTSAPYCSASTLVSWFGLMLCVAVGSTHLLMSNLSSYDKSPRGLLPLSLRVRQTRLQDACVKYKTLVDEEIASLNQNNEGFLPADLLFDRKRKVAFCKVPKAASTSWVDLFLTLNGGDPSDPRVGLRHTILRKAIPPPSTIQESREIGRSVFSFVTVRHPFERIAATYRDKYLHLSNNPVQDENFRRKPFFKIGQHIIKQERSPGLKVDRIYSEMPTFQELVRFIVHSEVEKFNPHWTPISLICYPCHYKYNVIANVSSLEADSQYILQKMNLKHQNSELPRDHVTSTATSSVESLFSSISEAEVRMLGDRYKVDFALFGFQLEPYWSYARKEEL